MNIANYEEFKTRVEEELNKNKGIAENEAAEDENLLTEFPADDDPADRVPVEEVPVTADQAGKNLTEERAVSERQMQVHYISGIDRVAITGDDYQSMFSVEVPEAEKESALLNVQDAMRLYEKVAVARGINNNLLALYEEDRPVTPDQYALLNNIFAMEHNARRDFFARALGTMTEFNEPLNRGPPSIDKLIRQGDSRTALEMLAVLKQVADRSHDSGANYYSQHGRLFTTSAVQIYHHFMLKWEDYTDITQWEYETLLWGAKETLMHPGGVGRPCKKEIGLYDPDNDSELVSQKRTGQDD